LDTREGFSEHGNKPSGSVKGKVSWGG